MRIIFAIALISFSITTMAHIPYRPPIDSSEQLPYHVHQFSAELGKSIAIYDQLNSENDIDVFSFSLNEEDFDPNTTMNGFTEDDHTKRDIPLIVTDENGVTGRLLHLGSLVPACNTYFDLLPNIAIVGPEQENLPAYDGDDLPFELEEGEGVYLITNDEQGEEWYEEFTFKSYYYQNTIDIALTETGFYKIYVWSPEGVKGDYVLEMGHVEVFGLKEILRSLALVMPIIYDNEIHSKQCKSELKDLDGKNPSFWDVINFYKDMFAN